MQDSNDDKSASGSHAGRSDDYRRKRVNRIKNAIIILAIIFMILPTIFCIILGVQVSRLQKQMRELVKIHSQYGLSYDTDDKNYVYAAELPSKQVEAVVTLIPKQSDATKAETNTKEADLELENTNAEKTNKENTETINIDTKNTSTKEGIYAGKKVYLTFDDGPSMYTDDILDILANYNVKATFFVVGKTDDTSIDLYKRIAKEGHTLGMHSYSHKYEKIYNSVEDFDKDFTKLWKLLYDTTGYKPTIYRFPGGSDNLVNENGMEEFIKYLNEHSMVYYDWNVLNGDATGVVYTEEQLIDNVLNGVKVKNTSIVLMHDSQTKETTVESLSGLIEELIAGGAEILPLDNEVTPIQMIKADSIK